jgi:hypothetical protein
MDSTTTAKPTEWERDLRAAMRRLGYTSQAMNEVAEYAGEHGTLRGCETLDDPNDVAALERLLSSHWDRLAPSAEDWDAAAWLDDWAWVPSDPPAPCRGRARVVNFDDTDALDSGACG